MAELYELQVRGYAEFSTHADSHQEAIQKYCQSFQGGVEEIIKDYEPLYITSSVDGKNKFFKVRISMQVEIKNDD